MNRFKYITAAAVAMALASASRADSVSDYIQFQAAIGVQQSKDMGDGTWKQTGAYDNEEQLRSPIFLVGLTCEVWSREAVSVRYHFDYVYAGQISASCLCVPDENYNAEQHRIVGTTDNLIRFNGFGHTQGVALTIEPGYTWRGFRFSAEAGPWLYWQTWHESAVDVTGFRANLSHETTMQAGWVVGARVERGNLSLSYRYYDVKQKWNPTPGLSTGMHSLTAAYRF